MIVYKVFNPLNGVHEQFENISDANARKAVLVSEYIAHHTPSNSQVSGSYIFKPDFKNDYLIAYNFMQSKLEQTQVQSVSDTDSLPVSNLFGYRHSIFNITENKLWARTFAYVYEGFTWHIKVKDNIVTDWYKNTQSYYDWVAFDLTTNLPIEQYRKFSEDVMIKENLVDASIPAVYTNFTSSANPLPSDIANSINFTEIPFIFAWSNKSYGLIVEYSEDTNIYTRPEDYPEWAVQANAELLIQDTNKVIENANRVYITEVEITEDGSEIWR